MRDRMRGQTDVERGDEKGRMDTDRQTEKEVEERDGWTEGGDIWTDRQRAEEE